MEFSYVQMDGWPPLSWVAECSFDSPKIRVLHGRHVETGPEWFCEAVWPGAYAEGDFDLTSLVAGTGGRLRADTIRFVSPGSVVDRLHTLAQDRSTWVANTLPGLLAVVGGAVSPSYPHYLRDFNTLLGGLDRCKCSIETSAGPVELVYFDNLRWDGSAMTKEDKPPEPEFTSFDVYREFLAESLRAVAQNMSAVERQHPYKMLATVSSGYDSPTVATLSREAGCEEGITLRTARGGISDSGEAIGETLGLRMITLDSDDWRRLEMPEVPFMSGEAAGEDVVLAPAATHLEGRVLMTGHHGDRMWDLNNTHLEPNLGRTYNSGLSMTEFRLWAGFIHLALPFWGVRRIAEVNAISKSSEMAPWVLGTGDYDRPICRRIVEGAGMPRGSFATSKKAVSVNLRSEREFLAAESLRDYMAWLRRNRADWIRARRLPPITNRHIDVTLRQVVTWVATSANYVRRLGRKLKLRPVEQNHLVLYLISLGRRPLFVRRYVFAWALERAKQRYETDQEIPS